MPLKVKAIIDTIKGTKLCAGSLVRTEQQNKTYCVMGALLHAVGATDEELEIIDNDPASGTYWDSPTFQRFKPELKQKFGIEENRDIDNLVNLNDGFVAEGYFDDFGKQIKESNNKRACHIMTTLAEQEERRLKTEEANAR